MNAPQKEDLARLRGHAVDQGLQPPQLVPRLDLPFDRRIVRAQHIEVGHEVQRHDGFAPHGVDQEVAGDGQEIGAPGGDPGEVLSLVGARQAFGHQVIDVEARRADSPQPRACGRLVRQHHGLEPLQPNEKLAHPRPQRPADADP